MSDSGAFGALEDDPAARIGVACVYLLVGLAAIASLFMRWIEIGVGDDADGQSIGVTVPLLLVTGVGAVLTLIGAGLVAADRREARACLFVAVAFIGVPSLLVVLVTEAVQSTLPTWLEPVLTNSDAVSFRAGAGAWVSMSAGIVLAVLTTSLHRVALVVRPSQERRTTLGASLVAILASMALIALRARPVVIAQVDGVDESIVDGATAVGGLAGVDSSVTDRIIGSLEAVGLDDSTSVRLVLGDLPVLGLVSLLAALALAVTAVLVLVRPQAVWTAAAGAATGTLLFCHWSVMAIVDVGNAVLPDSWFQAGDGRVVAAATTTAAARWAALWSTVAIAGFAVSVLGGRSATGGETARDEVVGEWPLERGPQTSTVTVDEHRW